MIKKIVLGLTVVAFACAGAAVAQQSGIKRTPCKSSISGRLHTITAIAEVPGEAPTAIPIRCRNWLCAERITTVDGKPPLVIKAVDPIKFGRRGSRRQGRRQAVRARGLHREGGRAAETGALRP